MMLSCASPELRLTIWTGGRFSTQRFLLLWQGSSGDRVFTPDSTPGARTYPACISCVSCVQPCSPTGCARKLSSTRPKSRFLAMASVRGGGGGARKRKRRPPCLSGRSQPRVKELQRILGFANFYRQFIRSFSTDAAPLTNLLKAKPKHLCSTPEATFAFHKLKNLFVAAPVLKLPNPTKQFIVEVDALEVGLWAELSQGHGEPGRLHPCTFISRKLSSAERHYDIRNREPLAVKAALGGFLRPVMSLLQHTAVLSTSSRLNA